MKRIDQENSTMKNYRYVDVKKDLAQHFLLKGKIKDFVDFNKRVELFDTVFLDEKKDEQALIHYHFYKALYNFIKLKSDLSLHHLEKAVGLAKKYNLAHYKYFVFYTRSVVCWSKTQIEEAIKFTLKALKYLKKIEPENIVVTEHEIILDAHLYNFFFRLNNYQKAFVYYHKAIKAANKFNLLEKVALIICNFIELNIELENHKLVKKEKLLLDKIVSTSKSKKILIAYASVELKLALFSGLNNTEIKILFDKNKNILTKATSTYYQLVYYLYEIEFFLRNDELEKALNQCEFINDRFKGNTNIFLFGLLQYLSWICLKDERYINIISESEKLKNLNINYDIEKLLRLLLEESKKYNKKLQIAAYNLVIDYYKKIGEYKKAFEYASDCLNQLKDFSLDNIHNEISIIIGQYESNQKIEQQSDLLSQQEKITQYFKSFAYTAAHDLKSPLQTIKKFAELIKASYNNSNVEQTKSYAELIVETSKRMDEFIKELIDSNSKGNFKDRFEVIDLNEIIRNVKQNLQVHIEESNYDIICNYKQSKIYGIKTSLEILMQNLISNAIKYRKKEVKSFVKIDYNNNGVFSISDNGIGIKKEMHQKIFEPFFRSSNKHIGSGIGLATCKRIIESLEGKIWVESELGVGSTFFFIFRSKADK